MKNIFRYLGFLLILITTDQFLKFLFLKNSICNKNIAWSIPIAPGVFYILSTIIFFSLVYFFLNKESRSEKMALLLILSGSLSNIIDRLARGCVVDFIDLKFWPVFNFADIYITIGVISLIILNFKFRISNQS